MNVGNMIKTGVAVVGAAASLAVLYYYRKNKKATPKDNSSESDSNKVLTKILPLEDMIDLLNDVSETMIIVFQQLGMQAVHMTQTGVSDDEINRTISEKFKSTMAVVENQICGSHGIQYADYKENFEYYNNQGNAEFKNALYPCRYLLSILEDTPIDEPSIPEILTEKHVILLNNAILELSNRCLDRVRALLCEQLKCEETQLHDTIEKNESLKEQVFDLVIEAEKESKKKILHDENISATDMIIASLLYRTNDNYMNAMEAISAKRMSKLRELGLNLIVCLKMRIDPITLLY